MGCTAAHLRSRSLNIVSLSDMIEGSYRSWDLYTTGQLVDGLQQTKKTIFIWQKWNHVVFSRATILSSHPVVSVCHFLDVRLYTLSLVFLFYASSMEVLSSFISRMALSIIQEGQFRCLSLQWDSCYRVWFRGVFFRSPGIFFFKFFFLFPLVWWCQSTCKFPFLGALGFFSSFGRFIPALNCFFFFASHYYFYHY